jgi:hypothetical protein
METPAMGEHMKSAGGDAADLGIAQTLAVAEAAGVEVSARDGVLEIHGGRAATGIAHAIEAYLRALGSERVVAFLNATNGERRRALQALPKPSPRKVFRTPIFAA